MGMPTPSIRALFTEVWIEYGVSMLVILLRFFARWRMFGFEKFDLGDVFAGLAMVCYSLAAAGTLFAKFVEQIFYSLETSGIYMLSTTLHA